MKALLRNKSNEPLDNDYKYSVPTKTGEVMVTPNKQYDAWLPESLDGYEFDMVIVIEGQAYQVINMDFTLLGYVDKENSK